MLVIEFSFPGGRFHANPWGRHVNEGVVEWPPSPYRLARALVDLQKRRRPQWEEQRLENILMALAAPAAFRLPPASSTHTRSFLSINKKNQSDKQKVFDAFVVIDRLEKLYMGFDADTDSGMRSDLSDLLEELNYLGRSESWVEARLRERGFFPEFNCGPVESAISTEGRETVGVACLRSPDEYGRLPQQPTAGNGKGKGHSDPLNWVEAICLRSNELLTQGWNSPPAMKVVNYWRNVDALRPVHGRQTAARPPQFLEARFAFTSTVLPRVTETLPVAERVRSKLMGIHKRLMGGDESLVSSLFSGKDRQGRPLDGHQHAFYWPLDEDGDGRLDHLIVRVGRPFDQLELQAIDELGALKTLWHPGERKRPDLAVVLTALSDEAGGIMAEEWVSATPFVTVRHHRRSLGDYRDWLVAEVERECEFHGLPRPVSVEFIDQTWREAHLLRWMEFIRNRKGERPLQGYGCILRFAEPVIGPFALGALCHYGLGLFLLNESKR